MSAIAVVTYISVFLFAFHPHHLVQGTAEPIKASLCDLYQNPEQYAGRMVEVRGMISGNDMWIDTPTKEPCPSWMSVVVVFPKDVTPAPGFNLVRDDSFKEFENAVYHARPIHIEATFEGRFDTVVTSQTGKRTRMGKGYGKKHEHDGRIVLYRVSDVVAAPLPRK